MSGLGRRVLVMSAWLVTSAAVAAHDFTLPGGTSPGQPGNPNTGQGPCNNPCSSDPDAHGDSDPVDLFRGELLFDRRDMLLPGRGLAVDITFHYRSQSIVNGQFGYGWDLTYNRKLRRLANADVTYFSGGNRSEVFTHASGGAYVSPSGQYSTLVRNTDGTYVLRMKHGGRELFDVEGNLVRIEDAHGNAITLEYDPAGLLPVIGTSPYFVNQTSGVVVREYRLTRITDTIGRTIDFTYDANGRLAAITTLGRTTSYGYDAAGNLTSVTAPATPAFPSGHTTTYAYSGRNLTEVRDAANALTLTTAYDAATDRVTSQTFDGGTATYVRGVDAGGNTVVDVVDRKGWQTRYTFDSNGRVTRSERFTDGIPSGEPASYVTSYSYGADGQLVREQRPRGNAVEYGRDALGNVTEVRRKEIGIAPGVPHPSDLVESMTHEPQFNQLKTRTDAAGRTTTFVYDYEIGEPSRGLLRRIEHPSPAGQIVREHFTYDAHGQLASTTDANGIVTAFVRDPATGFVVSVVRAAGTIGAQTTSFAYDSFGNVTAVLDHTGAATTYTYDSHDNVVRVVGPVTGQDTRLRYDVNDRLVQSDAQIGAVAGPLPALGSTSLTDAWQSTVHTYDAFGRIRTAVDDAGAGMTFTYDPNGNLATVLEANGSSTTYEYDERDLCTRVLDSQSPAGATSYAYDANGNLVSTQPPAGGATTFTYDGFDRLSRTTWSDSTFEQYGYDLASNLQTILTAGGATITYAYDVLDRLSQRSSPASTDTYTYDPGSRLKTASNVEATTTFTYDALDRVIEEATKFPTLPTSWSVGFSYAPNGEIADITYPDGTVVGHSYDASGRMTAITDVTAGTGLVRYAYDPLGRRTTIKRANGAVTEHEFDSRSRLVGIEHVRLPGVETRSYSYDALGRRVRESDRFGTHVFGYDPLSQLVQATRPAGFPFATTTTQLDGDGNRSSETTPSGTLNYVANLLDQYTSVGPATLTYDLAGNLSGDGTTTYVHDAENRLVSAAGAFGTATYAYDALGRRVRKVLNGTATYLVYGADRVMHEAGAGGAVLATYTYGVGVDEPLTMTRGSVVHWYEADPNGTVTALLDASGTVVEHYDYDAFGRVSITDGSGLPLPASAAGNPYLYTGRPLDVETGLYDLRARMYSPALGRFLERDPLGQLPDPNVYRYAGNHPLDATDPLGLHWTEWVPEIPQGVVDFSAGLGDTLSFGLTDKVRDWMGTNDVVNKCSGSYSAGEWTGVGLSTALGGAGGLRAAGSKMAGREFSHWIPGRVGRNAGRWMSQRFGSIGERVGNRVSRAIGSHSRWNGNYVKPARHYRHDPFRYPRGWRDLGPRWHPVFQQLDRVPRVYYGAALGAGYGLASKSW